jgi:hypothetical protein
VSQLVSAAANSTFIEFDTKIPSLVQAADIVEAFRLYHYGKDNFTSGGSPDPKSIYAHLESLQNQITDTINPLLLIGA